MPGIDQKLVSAYKKGGSNLNAEEMAYVESKAPDAGRLREITSKPFVSVGNKKALGSDAPGANLTGGGTLGDKDASDTGDVDQVDRFTKFSTALNTGIDMARQQRKDAVLDQVGGMAPTGSLPASSFAGVLNSFNNSAAPIEASLLKSATDFAQDSENEKKQNQNAIRELALNVATETGDTKAAKVIAALAESGDIDAAITASLAAYGDEYSRNESGAIVKKDKDDNETVVYDPGTQTSTGGETRKLFVGRDDSLADVPFVDYTKTSMNIDLVRADTKKYMGDIADTVVSSLNNGLERAFITDWIDLTTATEQYQDPAEYFKDWMKIRGLEIVPPKEKKDDSKKDEEEKDDFDALLEDAWAPSDPNG